MINIIKEFKERGGLWFLSSNIFDKIVRFSLTFFLIYALSKEDNGIWAAAFAMANILIPIKSLGLESGILQYGVELNKENKIRLFKDIYLKGLLISLGFATLLFIYTFFLPDSFSSSQIILYVLCFWIPAQYSFEMTLNIFRIIKDHKSFAKAQAVYNVLFIVFIILGFYFFHILGIALAFLLTSLLSFLWFSKVFLNAKKFDWKQVNYSWKSLLSYGFKISLSNSASLLLFYLDVLLIQYLLPQPEQLAEYRTATVIPSNLPIIASIFINNDYVHLVEEKLNKPYIKKYIFNYLKVFSLYALLVFSVFYFLSDYWWQEWLFNGKYAQSESITNILLFGTIAIILLRIPAGNILSAIGLAHINTIIAYAILAVNIILSNLLFSQIGLEGIAYGTVISLLLSGIIGFYYLFRNLRED
jgi:O-antigen/teichoic acid export membrane protein